MFDYWGNDWLSNLQTFQRKPKLCRKDMVVNSRFGELSTAETHETVVMTSQNLHKGTEGHNWREAFTVRRMSPNQNTLVFASYLSHPLRCSLVQQSHATFSRSEMTDDKILRRFQWILIIDVVNS